MNYRKLSEAESEQIKNVGSPEEMNEVLSQYYLEVFKVLFFDEFDGTQYSRYFLCDTARTLSKESGFHTDYIQRIY